MVPSMLAYLSGMTWPRLALWGYLVWWLGVAIPYFDPSWALWLNSLGIAAIIGTGLYLSTAYASGSKVNLPRLAIVRLYLMPFFVSSFAALIKGRGFFLVFHPTLEANMWPLAACLALVIAVVLARQVSRAGRVRATSLEGLR